MFFSLLDNAYDTYVAAAAVVWHAEKIEVDCRVVSVND